MIGQAILQDLSMIFHVHAVRYKCTTTSGPSKRCVCNETHIDSRGVHFSKSLIEPFENF